jgi:hypothetical protein
VLVVNTCPAVNGVTTPVTTVPVIVIPLKLINLLSYVFTFAFNAAMVIF